MHHLQNPFFELIRHDVVEPMLIEVIKFITLRPASPVHYKHNPVKTIKTSVMGTLNMLRFGWRRRENVAHVRRCTVIPWNTHKRSRTGVTSTRSACARATTRVSAWRRRCALITIAKRAPTSESRASSTLTVPAWR